MDRESIKKALREEEYKDIDPVDIYMNHTTFNRLSNLARQV